MTEPVRVPSVELLRKIADALHLFLFQGDSRAGVTCVQEEDFLPAFTRLADALRPWLATKAPGTPAFGPLTKTKHTAAPPADPRIDAPVLGRREPRPRPPLDAREPTRPARSLTARGSIP